MGNSLANELAFIWDADGMIKQKVALIAGGVAGVAATVALGAKLFKKK